MKKRKAIVTRIKTKDLAATSWNDVIN